MTVDGVFPITVGRINPHLFHAIYSRKSEPKLISYKLCNKNAARFYERHFLHYIRLNYFFTDT